ncbi:MAG: hypothetical protein ACJ8EY_02225 [Sphingomicrobium sp.]
MLKLLFAGAISLLTLSCATPSQRPAQTLELVDLTDDFARIYDRDQALPDAERVARFKSEFATILPGFYDERRVEAPAAKYDPYLLNGIKRFPQQRAGIERVSRQFAGLLAPAQRSFEAEFGSMAGYPPVYLVNSLGEFDGGTRDLPEGNRLMFGADVIDRLYKTTPIQPFFHHELFHLLHNRTFTECDQLWCGLWTEGLAVYVAHKLNPEASDAALLLTVPVPLRTAVEAHKAEAVCAVLKRLNSTDPADLKPLFNGGNDGIKPNLPARFAYYVGLLIAEDLGRTRSLKQLTAMRNDEVRPLLERSLRSMASC